MIKQFWTGSDLNAVLVSSWKKGKAESHLWNIKRHVNFWKSALFSAEHIIYSAKILKILAIGKVEILFLEEVCSKCMQKINSRRMKAKERKDKYSGEEDIKHIYRFQILPLRAIYIEGFPKVIDSIRHHP